MLEPMDRIKFCKCFSGPEKCKRNILETFLTKGKHNLHTECHYQITATNFAAYSSYSSNSSFPIFGVILTHFTWITVHTIYEENCIYIVRGT
jgi:hypothetical protein